MKKDYMNKLIRNSVREFSQKYLRPAASMIDETKEYPDELFKEMAKRNYMGVTLPKEYGGVGLGFEQFVIVIEEIARACGSSTMHITSPNTLVGHTIKNFGTEEQKRKYLVPIAKGEKVGTFAMSEPNAGSDASALETVARKVDGGYVINGRKTFITSGPTADFVVVFAITSEDINKRAVTAFFVEKGAEGLTAGKPERKMGMNGSKTSDIILEDVFVTEDAILGEKDNGFAMAMRGLDCGRIGVAGQAVGIAQAALDEAVKFTKGRRQFNRRIADFQGVQFMLADMQTRVQAARLLVKEAAIKFDKDQSATQEASMAKYYATETAFKVASDALQLHGAYGYVKDYPIERIFRESRVTTIYEGTSQIQQIVIARELLKD
ncbi:MAG: acyl-CoA dehydrogenase family protein [Peptoniphilus sp.]|nr:acyl-CoA dehydrogenase family protein [Peptoniphilus sp.]